MRTPIWVWQTMAAMLAVSLVVYALTRSAALAGLSQVLVALIVGDYAVNRYIRRKGWREEA